MKTQSSISIFESGSNWAPVSVVVPLYNYQQYIESTLDTILFQEIKDISLVVVDDCSTDRSASVVEGWMKQFGSRFNSCVLAHNIQNSGLAVTRNTGASISESANLFFLDADNLLYPRCLGRHLEVLDQSPEAMAAYSLIEIFDGNASLMGGEVFSRERLKHGNHIDAMAMIRRDYLEKIGGYHHIEYGWEDYDLWLRMCERGNFAIQIPEILSRYRVHKKSMLRSVTNIDGNHLKLKENIKKIHPWLELH